MTPEHRKGWAWWATVGGMPVAIALAAMCMTPPIAPGDTVAWWLFVGTTIFGPMIVSDVWIAAALSRTEKLPMAALWGISAFFGQCALTIALAFLIARVFFRSPLA